MAQQASSLEDRALYDALKTFKLEGKASVTNLSLKRDRGEMTFNGDFYFASPVYGKITGAVFIGEGVFRAEAPPFQFEIENLRRFLHADAVESNFKTAVLRFTDNTFDIIGKNVSTTDKIPQEALNLAHGMGPALLKETGANIPVRLAISMINRESPGLFLGLFDKGKLNRFTFMIDPQCRIPSSSFGINAGEKVFAFQYAPNAFINDLWITAFSKEEIEKGRADYSDEFDIVNPIHYKIVVDLRHARSILKTRMRIDFESLVDNLRAIPMIVNDGLSESDNMRLKHAMRVQSAQYKGRDIPCIQEDWESGLTFLLPEPLKKGEKFSIDVALDGDFIDKQNKIQNVFYLSENTIWYPRHGYLKRSTFEMVFRHNKNDRVASVGTLVREEPWPEDKTERLTEYRMDYPVSLISFAAGLLEHKTMVHKTEAGKMNLDFYTVPKSVHFNAIDEDFIMQKMGNAINYFSKLFCEYPYKDIRGAIHPFHFGQGLPTLLMLPKADTADRDIFKLIAHETAHQWWGGIVSWRSYRDQWLSEGFAEYSGLLYTQLRDGFDSVKQMMKEKRNDLQDPPQTDTGISKGKAVEMDSLILGQRLQTRLSLNAYSLLTYEKGCFVLRMLHYLFSDPYSGDDKLFYAMMKDFVERFKNKYANTDDFLAVANVHFAKTPIAQKFGLKDLKWFFQQWVYEEKMPNYRMEYKIVPGQGNQVVVSGKIIQENVPKHWLMPLPIVFKFQGNQKGKSLVYVNGPETKYEIQLPTEPKSVELDPDMWILSEKTDTKKY
jgi:hypothetical protein